MTNKDAQPTLNLLLILLHLGIIKEHEHNLHFSMLIHQIHVEEHQAHYNKLQTLKNS